ncbi:unnamed protein product [Urochloa humidicola]
MAELASGAVSSLLGVIRNEAALLGGVRGDVQFIKEEMESMNSFLLHLARTAAAADGGEHDEPVRTWMNQVRLLAGDCNNCIDLYLYRGNPDIHLPKRGLSRYLRWAPWFLQRMVAQHRAALKLRELKDRARDVGERRLRYGVEVPAKATGAAPSALPYAAGGGEAAVDDDADDQVVAATDHSGLRGALLGLRVLDMDDYFTGRVAEWIEQVGQEHTEASTIPSIAVVAPDNEEYADILAGEAFAAAKNHFRHGVLVDIPEVHWLYEQPRPVDILCYIWRELERAKLQSQSSQQQGDGEEQEIHWRSKGIWGIRRERRVAIRRIKQDIRNTMKDKIEDLKSKIREVKSDQLQLDLKNMKGNEVKSRISGETLAVLLLLLKSAIAEQDQQPSKKAAPTLAIWYDKIIETASKKLKDHMMPCLNDPEAKYADILREVFPKISKSLQDEEQDTNSTDTSNAGLGEQQIQVMIQKAKGEILHEVQEKLETLQKLLEGNQAICKPGSQGQILEAAIADNTVKIEKLQVPVSEVVPEETTEKAKENQGQIPEADIAEATKKVEEIKEKIEDLMKIKVIADKIQSYLKQERTLVIFKIDHTKWEWEEIRNNALSPLGCVAGVMIVTTSKNTQQAKEYCYPPREPMEYSLVGFYHDIILHLTRNQMNEEANSSNPQIFRGILEECEPHEFCMKILANALYAKPKRSNEELRKLHTILQAVSPKSFSSIVKKMFKFSYNDLQKEYKSCLLYLAIFPPGHRIRRSTLIGRWVVEGLITTEDWRWSSSVHKAKLCFGELINRWLVYPTDISATGEVKSCMVGHQVHEFITKVAEKQRIVETRLSSRLARHFSISNDLRLRGSDKIENFLQKLSESSQFCLLKVLDLEGCCCFDGKKQRYLKDICCKIKLLKYLSLRRTNVRQLPHEINNLHELEVLDIRQTKMHAFATRNVRLLKLKRLLAGDDDPSLSSTHSGTVASVLIPEKVEQMETMEVLSNVKPQTSQDLKDVGTLWQLRKLGVVIEDKDTHLMTLLEAVSNLNKCIRSLSITLLAETRQKRIPSRRRLLPATNVGSNSSGTLEYPKVLESLSISGTTHKVQLLPSLLGNESGHPLTKITLSNTSLSQNDLAVLSKLPMLCSIKLQCIAYTESKLTFKEGEFKKLKYILLEDCNMRHNL